MPARAHPSLCGSNVIRTKIVCTLGPASHSPECIDKLIRSGMNIARLNMAHCSHDFASSIIASIRKVARDGDLPPVGIWLDVNGPKVRTGKLSGGAPVHLKKGDDFFFLNDIDVIGDHTKVATTYTRELLQIGDKICIDDGALSFTVAERLKNSIRTIVENNGVLGENKGVTFPERTIEDLPALSPKDRFDLDFAIKQNVDFISISCIRDIQDMEEVRITLGNSQVKVLAKIENKRSMDNFESILRVADGVVIDRGYLGAEIDVDIISIAQKQMTALANVAGKPIMVANQMLESMTTTPRPTRSEAADVTNAVMDGVDGLVLSAETAVGEYVLETVATMRRILLQAELNTNYLEYQVKAMRNVNKPIHVNESIASSAVLCARQINATIIVCITEAGGTARLVAKYRPAIPVLATTMFDQTARQLTANFGLVPYHHKGDSENLIRDTLKYAVDLGLCAPGDAAVVTSGQVIGFLEGTTTKMQIVKVPEV